MAPRLAVDRCLSRDVREPVGSARPLTDPVGRCRRVRHLDRPARASSASSPRRSQPSLLWQPVARSLGSRRGRSSWEGPRSLHSGRSRVRSPRRSSSSALRRYRCGRASRCSSQPGSPQRRHGASRRTARDWLPTPLPGLHPPGSSACPSSEPSRRSIGVWPSSRFPSQRPSSPAVAAATRPSDRPIPGARVSLAGILGRRDARHWAVGELAANSAWAGTLVFSGALFTERYGLSTATTGVLLALIAAAYLAGNQFAARSNPARARRAMLEGSLQPRLPSLSPGRSRPPRSSRPSSSHSQHLSQRPEPSRGPSTDSRSPETSAARSARSARRRTRSATSSVHSSVELHSRSAASQRCRWPSVASSLRRRFRTCACGRVAAPRAKGRRSPLSRRAQWSAPDARFRPPVAAAMRRTRPAVRSCRPGPRCRQET